ncbi:MAG: hypothetical protein JNM69_36585, partial [Archangium sp.]|nr:hypothetical protein [Archangium sp.]
MSQVRRVRVFISSPSDVFAERKKAEEVIEQLQRSYGLDRVRLETVLWEQLPIQLDTPFQQGIEAVLSKDNGIDIAVFILWSRLGSPTGMRRPDGTEYRSGTEREFELMLSARKDSGGTRPALLAYVRRDETGFRRELDAQPRTKWEDMLAQFKLAEQFVSENFSDAQGRNLRAYHSFDVPVSFAERLFGHLRRLLDELLKDEVPVGARWTRAPYRGLEVFDLDDAPIFFGREQETGDLQELLRQRWREEGLAFACIVGASGAGKSSLARAGVAASLKRFNLDSSVSEWRAAFVLPRQTDGLVAEGVARELWRALPELEKRGGNQRDFVETFAKDPEVALRLVVKPVLEPERAPRVLLAVDQLEEVFTSTQVTAQARQRLWQALEAFARSGFGWVLTTLRSDFYATAQNDPGFLRLKGLTGGYDLVAPTGEGLAALIGQPAALAGVRFEKSGQTSLEARILTDALEQPDALPLLEYLLT